MSSFNIQRGISPDSVPYPKPSEISKREIIYHKGLPAWKYVSREQIEGYQNSLFLKFDLKQYEGAIINMAGGEGIGNDAIKFQKYIGPVGYAAYKEPTGGFGAIIKQEIPEFLLGKKVVIFEDVWETGGVITEMRKKLDPASLTVFLTRKDRDDQLYIPNALYAFTSVPEWIGGRRINIEYPGDKFYPKDAFRDLDEIVIRPSEEILQNLLDTSKYSL